MRIIAAVISVERIGAPEVSLCIGNCHRPTKSEVRDHRAAIDEIFTRVLYAQQLA